MKPSLRFSSMKPLAPIGEGGGETIAHDLLHALHADGHFSAEALGAFDYQNLPGLASALAASGAELSMQRDIATVGTAEGAFDYPASCHAEYRLSSSYVTTLARKDHFARTWRDRWERQPADVVLLQAEGALDCWRELQRRGETRRVFLYVQNGFEPALFQQKKVKPPPLLANSRFLQKKVREQYGLGSDVLYPAVAVERYRRTQPRDAHVPFTVMFVNPVAVKGFSTVMHLIGRLPDIRFLVVEGWRPLPPALTATLRRHANVTCVAKTWAIERVYEQADLLIAPSTWEEAFGRVVVEAHAAGVPTLASNVGGLPEAGGTAGLLVDDFASPQAWESALRRIVERPSLLPAGSALQENAARFRPERAATRFCELALN